MYGLPSRKLGGDNRAEDPETGLNRRTLHRPLASLWALNNLNHFKVSTGWHSYSRTLAYWISYKFLWGIRCNSTICYVPTQYCRCCTENDCNAQSEEHEPLVLRYVDLNENGSLMNMAPIALILAMASTLLLFSFRRWIFWFVLHVTKILGNQPDNILLFASLMQLSVWIQASLGWASNTWATIN